ncbi:hypothetical protein EVAR_74840_1 [Eumeta japonica]|uniref:Uncharacterized protein n=1 Tax=Eumeta variegata TaxID=151549 RepID=A0A4C1SPE4_EUMVA|nr:hypothetical protein EVAR_74840_1 [Eumeta japonica]
MAYPHLRPTRPERSNPHATSGRGREGARAARGKRHCHGTEHIELLPSGAGARRAEAARAAASLRRVPLFLPARRYGGGGSRSRVGSGAPCITARRFRKAARRRPVLRCSATTPLEIRRGPPAARRPPSALARRPSLRLSRDFTYFTFAPRRVRVRFLYIRSPTGRAAGGHLRRVTAGAGSPLTRGEMTRVHRSHYRTVTIDAPSRSRLHLRPSLRLRLRIFVFYVEEKLDADVRSFENRKRGRVGAGASRVAAARAGLGDANSRSDPPWGSAGGAAVAAADTAPTVTRPDPAYRAPESRSK